jgi:polysaccharide export outer membrane protein
VTAAAIAAAAPAAHGQQVATPQPPVAGGEREGAAAQAPVTKAIRRYRIQGGDTLELTFPFAPNFNQTMTVQPDGFIFLRSIGDQQAEGLTVTELSEVVRDRYGSVLRDVAVTIELKDFEKPYFVAAGAVERPGKYEIRGEVTLTQALAIAGGFKADAKRTNVVVFHRPRNGAAGPAVREINVKKLLDGKELKDDVPLEPGDLVFVSRSRAPSLNTVSSILSTLGWLTVLLKK